LVISIDRQFRIASMNHFWNSHITYQFTS